MDIPNTYKKCKDLLGDSPSKTLQESLKFIKAKDKIYLYYQNHNILTFYPDKTTTIWIDGLSTKKSIEVINEIISSNLGKVSQEGEGNFVIKTNWDQVIPFDEMGVVIVSPLQVFV